MSSGGGVVKRRGKEMWSFSICGLQKRTMPIGDWVGVQHGKLDCHHAKTGQKCALYLRSYNFRFVLEELRWRKFSAIWSFTTATQLYREDNSADSESLHSKVRTWQGCEGNSPVLVRTCRKTLCGIYSQPLHTPYRGRNSPGCHPVRERAENKPSVNSCKLGGHLSYCSIHKTDGRPLRVEFCFSTLWLCCNTCPQHIWQVGSVADSEYMLRSEAIGISRKTVVIKVSVPWGQQVKPESYLHPLDPDSSWHSDRDHSTVSVSSLHAN